MLLKLQMLLNIQTFLKLQMLFNLKRMAERIGQHHFIYDEILQMLNEYPVLFVTKSYSLHHVQIEARGQTYYFDLAKPHQVLNKLVRS